MFRLPTEQGQGLAGPMRVVSKYHRQSVFQHLEKPMSNKLFKTSATLFVPFAAMMLSNACESEYTVSATGSERDRTDTVQVVGAVRTYEVHLPREYETVDVPVVLLLHEADGSGSGMKYRTTFDLEADVYGFMSVYPNATSDWAYGCDCTDAEADGVDDVQFLLAMLDELDSDYGINRDSVFIGGYAEGGLMAQKAVCESSGSFAGLATVAATMSEVVAANCTPTSAVPVLMMQGTDDDEFPWDGTPDSGAASLIAADSAAQFWATSNGCGDRMDDVYVGTDTYYSFDVFRVGFDACPAQGEVILLKMDGAEHGWPGADFSASFEVGRFFGSTCCGLSGSASEGW